MLKTEGEAQGFQHFPADIKSVTSGEYSGILPSGGFQHFLQTLRVWLASWYHFSNSTNSRTKISLNLNTSGEYSGILPSGGLKKC